MGCNIRKLRYCRFTRPLSLLVSISLLLSTTANYSYAAPAGISGISSLDKLQWEIVDCASADKLNSTVLDIKKYTEKMFSGEFECHHVISMAVQNIEVYAVPLIGRGFMCCVKRSGRMHYTFIPVDQNYLHMTSPELWFDLLETYGDGQRLSMTLPLASSIGTAFSFLNEKEILSSTITKRIINLFQKQNYIETYDSIPCPCPPGMLPGACRSLCGGGGGGGGDEYSAFYFYLTGIIVYIVIIVVIRYLKSHIPYLSIISPKDDALYGLGKCIDFEVAVENSYSEHPCECTWTSNIDGEIGSGSVSTGSSSLSFQRCDFSPGEHILTVECVNKLAKRISLAVKSNITINIR